MKQIILTFDARKENPCVGLWIPDQEAWQVEAITEQSGNRILRTVDHLLTTHHIGLGDVTHIAAMVGPASYTQLRLFITTANTLAWAKNLPIFGFPADSHLPEDLARHSHTAKRNTPITPVYPTQLG